jgi:SAM-dependent methyltransferase
MAEPAADAASFYDDVWRKYAHLDAVSPAAFHRRRVIVLRAARSAPGARSILDVGCGQGELLRDLAARFPGAEVAGADVSEQSLADSRRRNPSFDLFQLDLEGPPLEARHPDRIGRYDLVVCSEVLEHIADDALAARRLAALLAPGGHLLVTVPGGKMSRYDEVIGHQRHYRRGDIQRLLSGAGLSVGEVVAWGFPFHNLYRTAVRLASRLTIDEGRGERAGSGVVGSALGHAYALFGRSLKPLFYLNVDRWGEQMIAIARRAQGDRGK